MRTMIFVLLCCFVLQPGAIAQSSSEGQNVDDIKKVIQSAYVEGIHNNGEISAIGKGFHPEFEMMILRDNKLSKLTITEWVESLKARRANLETVRQPEVTCKYLDVDVTGSAAVVKLELYREEKLLFTDYLCLYHFDEGWKIVTKLYFRH